MRTETYQSRVTDLQARIRRRGLDALLVIKPENVRYVTGLWGYSSRSEYAMPRRLICAVVPAAGEPVLIVPKLEYLFAQRRSWLGDIRYHVEWGSETETFGGLNLLNAIFREKGLGGKKIAVEKNFISAALYDLFDGELPASEIVASNGLVEEMRIIKCAEEIDILRISGKMAVQEYYAECAGIRPGVREYEIAMIGRDHAAHQFAWHCDHRNCGCTLDHPLAETSQIITSGPRCDMVHALASTRAIEPDDMILLDFCRIPQFQNYRIGFARNVAMRKPNSTEQDMFQIVLDAYDKAVSVLRPGVAAEVPDLVAREMLDKAGIGETFAHRTGRGVGIEAAELPEIGAGDKLPLQAGMVVTIEPSIYLPNFSAHPEDTYLITEDGAELLTRCPRELNVLTR
ncbi:Xaa-Pro peptidase family protein [Agrobacterium tumefaciens]|uniref:M24 family metallopeptidase n=1 Tax=Agrobacterium tumefaciens TaxID=358 RepID=UPI00224441A9|nr:Xaa-Pro peptidase family protein [Agrobacterium tumefaciens]MCW8143074.1 Xaa-Pro peptidase family protein [Agrobacterium tumefaciens]